MIPLFALLILIAGLVRQDLVPRKQAFGNAATLLVIHFVVGLFALIEGGAGWIRFLAWAQHLVVLALVVALLRAFWPEEGLVGAATSSARRGKRTPRKRT